MNVDPVLPERVSVPFSNFDIWNNLETSGLLCAVSDGAVLEFEVVRYTDSLWPEVRSKSKPAEVHIPLAELESVRLLEGWVQTVVEVKARHLKALSDVPGSKQGQIRLSIAEKDKPRAKELISIMTVRLSEHELRQLRGGGDAGRGAAAD